MKKGYIVEARDYAGMHGFDRAYEEMILGRSFVEYKEYYVGSKKRYRQTLEAIAGLGLPVGSSHLDIGGGQMGLMARALFGFNSQVGDVVQTAVEDITGQGVPFQRINLLDAHYEVTQSYNIITLLEVIEHIPVPPYLTLSKLAKILRPGGWLIMTTPNGFRIRNILRMLANREVLGIYRYPEGDEPLGHQHEYTLQQMKWQIEKAGYEIGILRHYRSGWRGATTSARVLHALCAPFEAFPHLRDGLIIAIQTPQAGAGGSVDGVDAPS